MYCIIDWYDKLNVYNFSNFLIVYTLYFPILRGSIMDSKFTKRWQWHSPLLCRVSQWTLIFLLDIHTHRFVICRMYTCTLYVVFKYAIILRTMKCFKRHMHVLRLQYSSSLYIIRRTVYIICCTPYLVRHK